MLDSITKGFSNVIERIKGRRFISEGDLDNTLRDIRLTLLEADVSLPVVKNFVKSLKETIVGQEIIKKISPADMIIKLVNDELIKIFGDEKGEINLSKSPTVILMIGVQGSGKTTTSAKLASRFKNKFNKKVLLVSLDTYRAAAREQLRTLADSIKVDSLEILQKQSPLEICKKALEIKDKYDIVIFDTAGRLTVDENMMNELKEIKKLTLPNETILVADSLTGQDAVNIAARFDKDIVIDSIILTRIEGDGRGGAAFSMRAVTGKPISYIGTGEKIADLDLFHPERIVSRILDKGDIISLVEKAEELVNKKEAEELGKKIKKGNFDLDDLLKQIKVMRKFGGLAQVLSFIPGASKIKDFMGGKGLDEKSIVAQEAIIQSMTKKERCNPDILNSSRKFRIAKGSGTSIQDVNSLLKKFKTVKNVAASIGNLDREQMKNIAKNFAGADGDIFG
ncbi:MAG: signal recognition particle protein [Planctomycetaceae bacterium]|jgi:signal recognition particle subunit SRP54|nr:signal recognition particle protein [Planctomycetaceae bacterium]